MYNAKVRWIAEETGESEDDVFDVLKGNIRQPYDMVDNVLAAESTYDYVLESHSNA